MSRAQPHDSCPIWRTPEAVHIDVRGLQPPEPMVAILWMLDFGEVGSVVIAHLDREPIFLYPELDERGWCYKIVPPPLRGEAGCEDEVMLRIVRCRT